MKKIFALLAIIATSFGAKAQFAGTLIVKNDTKCDVHYKIVGGTSPCGTTASTIVFTVPGMSTSTHTASSLGFMGISGALQYPVPPSCSTVGTMPYGTCPGYSPLIWTYSVNLGCTRCMEPVQFRGLYTVESAPGGVANLRFYP